MAGHELPICGGYVALHDAFSRPVDDGTITDHPLTDYCAAIRVGIVGEELCLDLPTQKIQALK